MSSPFHPTSCSLYSPSISGSSCCPSTSTRISSNTLYSANKEMGSTDESHSNTRTQCQTEYVAMVKSGNECQLGSYMLHGKLATVICCADVLSQPSSFVLNYESLGECVTQRTTEHCTNCARADETCLAPHLWNPSSRLCQAKRALHMSSMYWLHHILCCRPCCTHKSATPRHAYFAHFLFFIL